MTTFIATDLVSAPLLWVWPLAIYLASFIIAFSPRAQRFIPPTIVAAPAFITLLWVPFGSAGVWPVLATLLLELVALGIVAVALHGRLAADRPDPAHLTEFYLLVSTGGALASAFVAIVAPQVFPDVWEYPILLIGALVALALTAPPVVRRAKAAGRGLDFSPFFEGFWGRMLPYLVVSGLVVAALVYTRSLAAEAGIRWLLVGGLVLAVGARPWFLAGTTAFVLVLATFVLQPAVDLRERSFFGVTTVQRVPEEDRILLFNGTTVHGTQSTDPALRHEPTTYFSRTGPAGDMFALATPAEGAIPRQRRRRRARCRHDGRLREPGDGHLVLRDRSGRDPRRPGSALLHVPDGCARAAQGRPRRCPPVARGGAGRAVRPRPARRLLVGLDPGPPHHDGGHRHRVEDGPAGRDHRVQHLEPLLRPDRRRSPPVPRRPA